jgi:tetratricopeptide (TPR) repeat protein
VLSQLGRFDEAIGHAEDAVRIAEEADHPFTLHWGLFDLGRAYLRRGDLPRATRVLERCHDLCRTWQIALGTPRVAAALGAAYAFAGRADEALPLVAVARITPTRRSFFSAQGRATSRLDESTTPPVTPATPWRSPGD